MPIRETTNIWLLGEKMTLEIIVAMFPDRSWLAEINFGVLPHCSHIIRRHTGVRNRESLVCSHCFECFGSKPMHLFQKPHIRLLRFNFSACVILKNSFDPLPPLRVSMVRCLCRSPRYPNQNLLSSIGWFVSYGSIEIRIDVHFKYSFKSSSWFCLVFLSSCQIFRLWCFFFFFRLFSCSYCGFHR